MLKHLIAITAVFFALFSDAQTFTRSELSATLNNPWEITYGPDDHLWLTEFGGIVSRVNPITGEKQVVHQASDYFSGAESERGNFCFQPNIGTGTYGLALHPDFLNPSTAFIYFLHSYNAGTESEPKTQFCVKELTWNASTQTVTGSRILIPNLPTGFDHLGGRIMAVTQNGENYLYVTIGDNGISEENSPECYQPQSTNPNNFTQDISTGNGKIHRFHLDGSIPSDNPISGSSIFTRGHRNPQGLAYNTDLQIMYNIEHGDRTDDEINLLQSGGNYGWKVLRGFHDDATYPGEADFFTNYTPNPMVAGDQLVEPIYAWCNEVPDSNASYLDWCTVAPSDGIYYGNSGIPEWTNSLLVVTLKDGATTDREVFQFKLNSTGQILESTPENPNPVKFFGEDQEQNGRLRDITYSPDGKTIYLINNVGTDRDKITVYTYQPDGILTNARKELKVSPNPATDFLLLNTPTALTESTVQVIDVVGKTQKAVRVMDNKLDISSLANGTYTLLIDSQVGSWSARFIVAR